MSSAPNNNSSGVQNNEKNNAEPEVFKNSLSFSENRVKEIYQVIREIKKLQPKQQQQQSQQQQQQPKQQQQQSQQQQQYQFSLIIKQVEICFPNTTSTLRRVICACLNMHNSRDVNIAFISSIQKERDEFVRCFSDIVQHIFPPHNLVMHDGERSTKKGAVSYSILSKDRVDFFFPSLPKDSIALTALPSIRNGARTDAMKYHEFLDRLQKMKIDLKYQFDSKGQVFSFGQPREPITENTNFSKKEEITESTNFEEETSIREFKSFEPIIGIKVDSILSKIKEFVPSLINTLYINPNKSAELLLGVRDDGQAIGFYVEDFENIQRDLEENCKSYFETSFYPRLPPSSVRLELLSIEHIPGRKEMGFIHLDKLKEYLATSMREELETNFRLYASSSNVGIFSKELLEKLEKKSPLIKNIDPSSLRPLSRYIVRIKISSNNNPTIFYSNLPKSFSFRDYVSILVYGPKSEKKSQIIQSTKDAGVRDDGWPALHFVECESENEIPRELEPNFIWLVDIPDINAASHLSEKYKEAKIFSFSQPTPSAIPNLFFRKENPLDLSLECKFGSAPTNISSLKFFSRSVDSPLKFQIALYSDSYIRVNVDVLPMPSELHTIRFHYSQLLELGSNLEKAVPEYYTC